MESHSTASRGLWFGGRNDIGGPRCRETRRGGRTIAALGIAAGSGSLAYATPGRGSGVPSRGHHPRSGDGYASYNGEFKVNARGGVSSETVSAEAAIA